MRAPSAPVTPSVGRWLAVVGGTSFVLIGVGTAVALGVRDRLPVEVASHHGADGVDATQPLTGYLVTSGAVLAVITVLLAALTLAMPGDARRVLGVTQVVLAAMLGMTLYGSLIDQLGLADARHAPLPGRWLAAGLGLGTPLAVLVWRLGAGPFLDGIRTVQEVAELLRIPFAYIAKVLFNLQQSGLIEAISTPAKPAGDLVPTALLDRLSMTLTEVIGPMAPLVMRDQIEALGATNENLPEAKLDDLIRLIGKEISDTKQRNKFEESVYHEISNFKRF